MGLSLPDRDYYLNDKMSDKQIDSVLSYIKSHWEDEIYERQISISK